MYDPSPIEIVAPAQRRRFSSAQQALAYYQAVGVNTHEDVIVLAGVIREEFAKVHAILDDVILKLEADREAEQASQE